MGGKTKSRTTEPHSFGGFVKHLESLKIGGGLLCFSRWDVQQVFIDALKIAGFDVKSVLIWDREHHGMGDLKGNFSPQYDTIIFAVKGRYLLPGKRPSDVIRCKRLSGSELVHPNEKPLELMKKLVEYTTKPNDVVLDPFLGSGATIIAAKTLNRNYIGIELDEKYWKIANQRVEDVK